MQQVAPNIYQLHIPLPDSRLSLLNTYLVKTDQGCLLIDTGWNTDAAYRALITELAELQLSPDDLKFVVITHFHPDHIGLYERLSKACSATFIQHKTEMKILSQRRDEAERALRQMERWITINGFPEQGFADLRDMTLSVYKLGTDHAAAISVRGGEAIHLGEFDFEIIWTPGHSPGLLCLHEARLGYLFCSDHVLEHTTPNISLFSEEAGNPLKDYFESLERVARLPVNVAFPAHGKIIHDLPGRVQAIISHHQERLEEMFKTCNGKPRSGYEIAGLVPWSMQWEEMSMFHRRFALLETLAHLEFLLHSGRISKEKTAEGIFYRAG